MEAIEVAIRCGLGSLVRSRAPNCRVVVRDANYEVEKDEKIIPAGHPHHPQPNMKSRADEYP